MRGKDRGSWVVVLQSRITPAYAGKRRLISTQGDLRQDHPRLCGEKVVSFKYRLTAVGSPPPMRGKVGDDLRRNIRIRITPAYAGKR